MGPYDRGLWAYIEHLEVRNDDLDQGFQAALARIAELEAVE